MAGVAFAGGRGGRVAAHSELAPGGVPLAALAVMMVLFFHAARMALVVFDPYMSSRPLAEALLDGAAGQVDCGRPVLHFLVGLLLHEPAGVLLNGRVNNLVYGSYAPDAPQDVFIDDARFQRLWNSEPVITLWRTDRKLGDWSN